MATAADFESKLAQVQVAIETAMSRIQSGEDRQALIHVMVAVAALHDAFVATVTMFSEAILKDEGVIE
jgi:hypothetical protein